jgi:anti-sigma factor (TIGR02949 family)
MTESCNTTRASLSAYVDGELPPDQADAVAEHLANCAGCSAEYETLLETISLLRSQLKRYTAPDVLRARVRTALASTPGAPVGEGVEQLPPPRRRARFARWTRAASWAAVILIAAALGSGVSLFVAGRDRQASSTAAEVLSSHVRSLMPDHLTDVRSSDQHNVKPWFNGRLDFSPNVPRLEEQGFPLLGGRLDYVEGRPVAVVVYGRRQHIINVYSWPTGATDAPPAMTTSHGYTLLHWRSRGSEHWVVSDLNTGELQAFAALLGSSDPASGTER